MSFLREGKIIHVSQRVWMLCTKHPLSSLQMQFPPPCTSRRSRGLTSLSNVTIRPLAAFSCVPPVTECVFSRIGPMLKIVLASNNLTTLPAELFNLDRLTVLCHRANRLHELPPGIGKLHHLQELNLSQNGMQYLPFEILDIFSEGPRLQSFTIHPNPFHEPRYSEQETELPVEEEC